ncbi:MAG: DUF429 domain-containing protein [Spirochaetales bacterium]|nr:DUF429 domain-containing protein [Spirochaetales bacterium]
MRSHSEDCFGESTMLIGLDAAVDDKNNGLVALLYSQGCITDVLLRDHTQTVVEQILDWWNWAPRILLGVDSPLGWPLPFQQAMSQLSAGRRVEGEYPSIFYRLTDIDIHQRFRKKPLDVAADRIARTAFCTLERLDELRQQHKQLHLLFSDQEDFTAGFIEVYPAATLLANGCSIQGYKKSQEARKHLLVQIMKQYSAFEKMSPTGTMEKEDSVGFSLDQTALVENEHLFDAFICALSALDFLEHRAQEPDRSKVEIDRVHHEGWTWVKNQGVQS